MLYYLHTLGVNYFFAVQAYNFKDTIDFKHGGAVLVCRRRLWQGATVPVAMTTPSPLAKAETSAGAGESAGTTTHDDILILRKNALFLCKVEYPT